MKHGRWLTGRAVLVLAVGVAVTGVGSPARAIVGGTLSNRDDYPYFVTVEGTEGVCAGGSVISDSWVLTAAHCVDSDLVDNLAFLRVSSSPTSTWHATELLIHPLWDGNPGHGHDLALIHVPDGALAGIPPVQVGAAWDAGAYAPGNPATIMGYGSVSGSRDIPPGFMVASTVLRSDSDMQGVFDGWNNQLMIGAGVAGRTACHGDSGGPLVVRRGGRPVQVGVVSFGTDACDNAAAFTELSGPQLAWVASHVPSIMDGWGDCVSPDGTPGHSASSYSDSYPSGAPKDGQYYWVISCPPLGSDGRPAVLAGDFNHDGRTDLALAALITGDRVPVALSAGDGAFAVSNSRSPDFAAWARVPGVHVLTGDFNRDGATDIALLPGPGIPWWYTIPVAMSNGDGTFTVTNSNQWDFAGWVQNAGVQALTGDFNADGRTDMALLPGPGMPWWYTIPVAFSNGDGTFRIVNAPSSDFTGWAQVPGVHAVTGDFDRDGRADMALLPGPGTPWWYTIPVAFSNGDGTFRIVNTPSSDFAGWAQVSGVHVVSGDFDRDGRADMALLPGPGTPWWYTIPVAFSNGDGTFRITNMPSATFAARVQSPGVVVVTGDFNHDGRTDIALTGVAGWVDLPVALSNGDGSFTTVAEPSLADFGARAATVGTQVVTGDFDHDGRTDIALAGGVGWTTLPIAFSDGDGTFHVVAGSSPAFAGLAQPHFVRVPAVLDDSIDEATRSLGAVNLTVAQPVQSVSDTYCRHVHQVFSQSPGANSWAFNGSTVTLTIGQQPPNPCP